MWMDFVWIGLLLAVAILIAWQEGTGHGRRRAVPLGIHQDGLHPPCQDATCAAHNEPRGRYRKIGHLEVWENPRSMELPPLTSRDRGES